MPQLQRNRNRCQKFGGRHHPRHDRERQPRRRAARHRRGAIHGAADVGGDLGVAAKGAVIGTLKGTQGVAGAALEAIGSSVENLVRTAAEIGGDAGATARHAAEGALLGAKEVGVNALDAVATAAGVRSAITGVIAGVPVSPSQPSR